MTIRYYRFTTAPVLDAVLEFSAHVKILQNQSRALAEAFGGRPLYGTSVHGRSFCGLIFDPPKDSILWTKPDRHNRGAQQLRAKVAAAHRSESNALRARWQALQPTIRPSLDAVWAACGTDWGTLLFGGAGYIMRDTAFYVATRADLSAIGEEITGGEYDAANKSVGP
jgi:hypothetical protein